MIDTMRQTLPVVVCSVPLVRAALEVRHRPRVTRIIPADYVVLGHWEHSVNLLGEYNEAQRVRRAWASLFHIICVDLTWLGYGEFSPEDWRERAARRCISRA